MLVGYIKTGWLNIGSNDAEGHGYVLCNWSYILAMLLNEYSETVSNSDATLHRLLQAVTMKLAGDEHPFAGHSVLAGTRSLCQLYLPLHAANRTVS